MNKLFLLHLFLSALCPRPPLMYNDRHVGRLIVLLGPLLGESLPFLLVKGIACSDSDMLQSSFASSGTSLFAGLEEQSLTRLDGVRHLPSINASTIHRHLLRCCYLLFESRTGSYSPLMCSVYRTINDSSLSQKTVLIVRLRLNWLHPD